MSQRSLFDPPEPPPPVESLPYQPHSATSEIAALRMAPNAGTLRAKVLDFIRQHGAVTDEQIANGLSMNPSTERPRRIELVAGGLVEQAPGNGTTAAGRPAALWRAK